MGWERVAASFCLLIGLSLLAGFITQFRDKGYMGLLGMSFLVLAVSAWVSRVSVPARTGALGAAGVLFFLAIISAVLHTRASLAEIRLRHKAFEEQMLAMLEVEREKHKKNS